MSSISPMIISGGIVALVENAFEKKVKVVKAMPNTPALVLEAMSAVSFNDLIEEVEKEEILKIFSGFGKVEVVKEELMDAVTAVSGSSPAYVYMMIEAMADAAVLGGMPRTQAYEFAAQAVYGSAKLVLESGKHPGELKDMVCSPGGTTIEGVRILEEKGMRGAVMDALLATVEKSKKL